MARRLALPALLLALTAWPAPAEVVIEIHHHPLLQAHRAASGARAGEAALSPMTGRSLTSLSGATGPSGGFWFVPGYRVDTTDFSDTTLWGARNESDGVVHLTVQYFDVFFVLQKTQEFDLQPKAILPINIRDVSGLPVDPDGFARGLVRIDPDGAISVDQFQVDPSENLAFGNPAFTIPDLCTEWQVRFLSFDARGSIASFLVNGPRGAGPAALPTVMGDVYDEQGSFINSFTLRTDQWIFDVRILDFVLGGVGFGVVELVIDSIVSPSGLVTVNHSAEGRFSVGVPGVCRDTP